MENNNINNLIEELLNEYKENREELKKMVVQINELKENVESMFPKNMDVRNKYALEEKVKTVIGFFDTILKTRQEINKSLKDEIDLRYKVRELLDKDEIDDIETLEELRKIQKRLTKRGA
jgi:hypothetical protein